MAAVLESPAQDPLATLCRTFCPLCSAPVLEVVIDGETYHADVAEWEPRAACSQCAATRGRKRGHRAGHCTRCGGEGYVGSNRPTARMLGVDVAWSDEGHVRLVGPRTKRMRGEALHALHSHDTG